MDNEKNKNDSDKKIKNRRKIKKLPKKYLLVQRT